MNESKIELTERLRREGRDEEALRHRNQVRQQLRSQGKTKKQAMEGAWEATRLVFPPPPPSENVVAAAAPVLAVRDIDEMGQTEGPFSAGEDAVEGKAVTLAGSALLPVPWADLPESADFAAEVEWVHQNRVLVVEERPAGKSLLHWDRARKPAPSYGAVNLMEFAATNRKGFMDILQRVKPSSESEGAAIKREKTKIDDIKTLLEELREGLDAELRADVPGVLQHRVQDMLSNWGQQCGVSLAANARACLDSAIVGLIRDSMRAVASSSGGE